MVANGRKYDRTASGTGKGSATKASPGRRKKWFNSGHHRSSRNHPGQVDGGWHPPWDGTTAWETRNCENKPSLVCSTAHDERKLHFQLKESPAQGESSSVKQEQRSKILASRGHWYDWSQQLRCLQTGNGSRGRDAQSAGVCTKVERNHFSKYDKFKTFSNHVLCTYCEGIVIFALLNPDYNQLWREKLNMKEVKKPKIINEWVAETAFSLLTTAVTYNRHRSLETDKWKEGRSYFSHLYHEKYFHWTGLTLLASTPRTLLPQGFPFSWILSPQTSSWLNPSLPSRFSSNPKRTATN